MNSPRSVPLRLLLLAHVLFVLSGASAQQVTPSAGAAPDAITLAKYDKNQNGKIDTDELAAIRADEAKAATGVVTGKSTNKPGDDVVQLSPFQVSGNEDKGYLAAHTLSGTRINSKLEDLAASITVVTKQQLMDTAAVDLNDIFLNTGNTEGTFQFTNMSVATVGGQQYFVDDTALNPQSANRVRGLGAANIAVGGFATTGTIPVDTYNIDAVEVSRGPNSNIFGLGEASGTVNLLTARANLTREISNVSMRVDSYGGYRGTWDFNRPLYKDKAALRVTGLYEEKGFIRKPSRDRTNRYQVALTLKPFETTTIRASYEGYHNYNSRPNSVTPRDYVTPWINAGRPTWDPVTFTAKRNGVSVATITAANDFSTVNPSFATVGGIGMVSNGIYSRANMFIDNGQISLITVGRRAGDLSATSTTAASPYASPNDMRYLTSWNYFPATLPLFANPGVSNKSIYDWTSVNFGGANFSKQKADTYQVELEQWIVNTPMHQLAFQAGFQRQDVSNYARNYIGASDGAPAALVIDINERNLDGTANPYFMRPMVTGNNPQAIRKPELNDVWRGTLAYKLDLTQGKNWWGKWAGKHNMAAYGEGRRIINVTNGIRYQDMITDTSFGWYTVPAAPGNNRYAAGGNGSRFFMRWYLGDNNGQNVDYGPEVVNNAYGPNTFYWYNGATNPATSKGQTGWLKEQIKINEIEFSGQNWQRREIRTLGFVYQGFFWKDRIIPTLGVREDRPSTAATIGLVPFDSDGFPILDQFYHAFAATPTYNKGKTRTKGIVVKALPWVSLKYNQADSFQPEASARDLFGNLVPNPTGKGKDYGFSLSLLQGKLNISVNRYQTVQKNARNGSTAVLATRPLRLDGDLLTSGAGNDPFDLEDAATTWVTQLKYGSTATFDTRTPSEQSAILTEVYTTYMGGLDAARFIATRAQSSTVDVNTIESKGLEFEINYNPSSYWTLTANVTQQKAVDTALSEKIAQYVALRLPWWTTVKVPTALTTDGVALLNAGRNWWDVGSGTGQLPSNFYAASIDAPYALAVANTGKPRPQTREWRYNASTRYQLAGITENKWLKNASIGGSLRWEDKAVIGFLGAAPDADGVSRHYDANKPVYDKARVYADLMAGYSTKLFNGKVRANIQLNVRNVFENGRLQVFGVNPDGRPRDYRIVDPRQFILTTTFDL
jgi:outer membrane receptor protein involved in Fe transport